MDIDSRIQAHAKKVNAFSRVSSDSLGGLLEKLKKREQENPWEEHAEIICDYAEELGKVCKAEQQLEVFYKSQIAELATLREYCTDQLRAIESIGKGTYHPH